MKKKFFIPGIIVGLFFIGSFCSAGELQDYHLGTNGTVNGIFSPGYSYEIIPLDNYMYRDSLLRLSCYTRYNENKANCGMGCSFDIDSLLNEGCSLDSIKLTCHEGPCNFTIDSVAPPIPPLLPGGQEAFSGVVSNLTNSVNEFIPLIVYIGIGIICACIGFVSIKRFINRLRNKTLSPFK